MTKKEAFEIVLKVFGILALIYGIYFFPSVIFIFFQKIPGGEGIFTFRGILLKVIINIAIVAVYFLCFYIGIFKTTAVSDVIIGADEKLEFLENGKNEGAFFDLIMKMVGMWFFLDCFPKFLASFLFFVRTPTLSELLREMQIRFYEVSDIVSSLLITALSLFLIFNSGLIAKIVYQKQGMK